MATSKIFGYPVFFINLLLTLYAGIEILNGLKPAGLIYVLPYFLVPFLITVLSFICVKKIKNAEYNNAEISSVYSAILKVNGVLLIIVIGFAIFIMVQLSRPGLH